MGKSEEVANGCEENDDFSELIKNYSVKSVDSKTPVKGIIIDFIDDGVIIDIGQKTEGILKKDELLDWDGNLNYKIGDEITDRTGWRQLAHLPYFLIAAKKGA